MTNEDLTRIYHEANGIVGKNPPITTERIFTAMRAAILQEREACAKHVESCTSLERAWKERGPCTIAAALRTRSAV